ncbi:AAA family ATPase [Streptomyces neyagawaensis]|uniref:AAA family ATPase n=1 Tax=Streptomyces neyagawaensis TaxID=42238 RepID=UPI00201D18FA|nr:AAA family ATPase [Streptomyces neyagawaensis]MCL6737896.1 ATP-binding protein [Streptomyces neyagawaensis]MDE1684340.1 ATP-binding protein [Streptomyces neyagawaensis]
MLLWINGPFGGGKTHTAHEIQRRLPGSVICDPEHPGFGLHRMLPPELRGDFQDLVSWRQGVVEVLDLALTRHDGVVIAPMTVTDPVCFAETVGRLRELGHDVRHFTLLARRETVLGRLRERGFGRLLGRIAGNASLRGESWAVGRLDHCLERLGEPEFAEHLWTDHTTVPKTADRIAVLAGLTLRPNTDGPLRTRLRQARVGVRHMRFD